jgi:hypothetical protein
MLKQNNWWLCISTGGPCDVVGYYPASLYKGGQLSRNAEWIEYGGETASNTSLYNPMGSGQFAKKGFKQAAYQHSRVGGDLMVREP